jgi:hypothetical protein
MAPLNIGNFSFTKSLITSIGLQCLLIGDAHLQLKLFNEIYHHSMIMRLSGGSSCSC